MSDKDIRTWAAANDIELNARGPIPKRTRESYFEANPEEAPGEVEMDRTPEDIPTAPESQAVTERAPGVKKKGWSFGGVKSGKPRSVATGPRASTASLFSGAWTLAANFLGNIGSVPTARVLQMQAPVAGAILDRELRGTFIDKLAQPVAKMVNKGSSIGGLVALPLMVELITRQPHLYETLKPYMVEALYGWFDVAGPELEKKRKLAEKRRESLGFDPEEMLAAIFAPTQGATDDVTE